MVRQDVTGRENLTLTFTEAVAELTLETLTPVPDRKDAWYSQVDRGRILVRGLLPLAGDPVPDEAPEVRDGPGVRARFFHLKGLVWSSGNNRLYVTDGHALRQVTLDGQVTTLAGQVAVPGFWDEFRDGTPCFRDPGALVVGDNKIYLADEGNHAIRRLSLPNRTLSTVAGDPQRPELGWGLLRDGLEDFPPEDFATLRQPRGLAGDFTQYGGDTLYVASGTCLAQMPAVTATDAPRIQVTGSFSARLGVPGEYRITSAPAMPGRREAFHFIMKFTDPDGSPLGPPLRETMDAGTARNLTGPGFTQEGIGRIQMRVVTEQGVSSGIAQPMQVR